MVQELPDARHEGNGSRPEVRDHERRRRADLRRGVGQRALEAVLEHHGPAAGGLDGFPRGASHCRAFICAPPLAKSKGTVFLADCFATL